MTIDSEQMNARRRALGVVVLLAVLVPLPVARASSSAASSITPSQASALGQQAFLYGFPLLEFLRVRRTGTSVKCPDRQGDAPVNSFSNETKFVDPSERTVVAPNVDTLYSIAALDLGRGPVTLGHPNMGRRYFVFELLDPYTNVIGYVGSRTTGSRAGRFAITWTQHPGRRVPGAHVVHSAYRFVWVIGRTLASDRTDQVRAASLMAQYRLTPPGGPRHFAAGCRPGRPTKATTPTGLAFLDALGSALREVPPPARDLPLLRQLSAVGVGPGLRPERAGLSPAALSALVAAVDSTAHSLPALVRATVLAKAVAHGGWATPPTDIGAYGTDYTNRAAVALVGLGANTSIEAVYPTAYADSTGQTLDGSHSYRLVFAKGQLPPARAFWSLTLYDSQGFLVANPEHKYAIGSSHPPLVKRSDGSVVVVVQRTRPSASGGNWLPEPAGQFRLGLRLYEPTAAVLNGRWQPPPIERLAP